MLTLTQIETRLDLLDRCLERHQHRLDWLRGKLAVLALLVDERARRVRERPPLTVAQVLSWADAHRERTGSYPAIGSGSIPEAQDLRWRSIDMALRYGALGLPRDLSLSRLLQEHRDWKGRGRRKREA